VVNLVDFARAFTPEGDELTLRQRGGAFEIRFNGWEVMSNRGSLSEETLARLVCEGLGPRSARILIGGLGMGYTVRQRSIQQVLTRALLSRSSSRP
jgi:hypothetical protein